MGVGIFPATYDRPTTGYTFTVLAKYHNLSVRSRLNGNQYCQALARWAEETMGSPESVSLT